MLSRSAPVSILQDSVKWEIFAVILGIRANGDSQSNRSAKKYRIDSGSNYLQQKIYRTGAYSKISWQSFRTLQCFFLSRSDRPLVRIFGCLLQHFPFVSSMGSKIATAHKLLLRQFIVDYSAALPENIIHIATVRAPAEIPESSVSAQPIAVTVFNSSRIS